VSHEFHQFSYIKGSVAENFEKLCTAMQAITTWSATDLHRAAWGGERRCFQKREVVTKEVAVRILFSSEIYLDLTCISEDDTE
jgi:hypothetical protein